MSFQVAFSTVLLTLFYIAPGFLIGKLRKAKTDHLASLSAVLIYICGPCMHISTFLSMDFSWEGLRGMALFFVVSLGVQCAFMGILYALFSKRYEDGKYRLLTASSVMGNVGFFGLPVIRTLLPDHPEVACYAAIYCISMNVLAFTVGIFCLTRKKEYITLRAAIVNPTTLGFFVAVPLYLVSARRFLPPMLYSSLKLLGDMSTPLCMIILGIRLAAVPMKKLFGQPVVYGISLCKLLLFPLFCAGCAALLPLSMPFRAAIVILSGTPCASIIFNLAEMHHTQMELSADCVLVSTLLCFLTIPLLTLLV